MLAPEIPPNEHSRLAALRALLILDTPPERRFDNLTQYAAVVFNVPIALITLVDCDRQWFKSRYGIKEIETARDISFCGHAILGRDILIVEDALKDPRFIDNPMVTGHPGIRFYAGAPLCLSGGERVGTLCLIDHRPRTLRDTDLRILSDLGRLVVLELEHRQGAGTGAILAKMQEKSLAKDTD